MLKFEKYKHKKTGQIVEFAGKTDKNAAIKVYKFAPFINKMILDTMRPDEFKNNYEKI